MAAQQVLVAVGGYDLPVSSLQPVRMFETTGLPGLRFTIRQYPAVHAVHLYTVAHARSFAGLRGLIGGAR